MYRLNLINELDQLLYEGSQKNERTVIVLIDQYLHSISKNIVKNNYKDISPIYVRNQDINLKIDIERKIFHLKDQDKTEMDILIINDISPFGNKTKINYYIEVEMSGKDVLATHRLGNFAYYCNNLGIVLSPILVTNVVETEFQEKDNIVIINIDDLKKYTGELIEINNPLEIPGVAWDNAAIAYYIMDIISQKERYPKNELNKEIEKNKCLYQLKINLEQLAFEKDLSKILKIEEEKKFRTRYKNILNKLEEYGFIMDSPDDKNFYILTERGSEYTVKWWGS